jgi:hypothetical protein
MVDRPFITRLDASAQFRYILKANISEPKLQGN